jgi:hypothetical protein
MSRQILVQELDGSRIVAEAVITQLLVNYTIVGMDGARPVVMHATNLLDALVHANRYVEKIAKKKGGAQ